MAFLTLVRLLSAMMLLLGVYQNAEASHLMANRQTNNDTLAAHLKNSLVSYYKNYPQEKVFAHTNQSVYATGQTVWYKLYVTAYGKPSAISKIVYVQLSNSAGKVLIQNKHPLKDGTAYGNIDLPDSLNTGWYQLRGFTSWMCNFDEQQFFHQLIYIKNVADTANSAAQTKTLAPKYHVEFYPEGGDMVIGNTCNIAFKATDANGKPANIYGEIVDNNKKAICNLATLHNGMGIFKMEPEEDASYTAMIHFPDETVQYLNLPVMKKQGIVMRVNAAAASAYLQIKITYTGPKERYRHVLLAAFQNNGNLVTYKLELSPGINNFNLKKNIFSSGILRLTVFDQSGLPAAERAVFVYNHDQLNLRLKAVTSTAGSSKKQLYNLSAFNAADNPVAGSFSVSVTEAGTGAGGFYDNICSSLLVSSELKGDIFNPGSYFKNDSDSLKDGLDLVMLTNGWRHFKWEEVLNNKPVKFNFPVEKEQFIAGKIVNYAKTIAKKQQHTIKLLILNQDSSKYIGYVTPDSTGAFILNSYNHTGMSTLYLETTNPKNRREKVEIKLINSLADSLNKLPANPIGNAYNNRVPATRLLVALALKEKEANVLMAGTALKTISIKDKKLTPTEQVISKHVTSLYSSVPEYTLDLVNNPTLDIGLVNYIRGRFPGLRIEEGEGDTYFYYGPANTLQTPASNNSPQKMHPDSDVAKPYFFLNEAPVKFEDVKYISLQEIALIRFMPPPVVFAPYNGGNAGAILIYTKNNTDESRDFVSREVFDKYYFRGYSITREFSGPDNVGNKNNVSSANQVTAFWAHSLITDSSGQATFSFYKPDRTKKYNIIIQGIGKDGRIGYLEQLSN